MEENRQEDIEKHARIISDAIWKFDPENPVEYLKLAAVHEGSRNIAVYIYPDMKLFLSVIGPELSVFESFLFRIKLIYTVDLSADIYFESDKIGIIESSILNRDIYSIFYASLIALLLIISSLFYIRNLEAKGMLAVRVEEKTKEYKDSEERYHTLVSNIPGITYISVIDDFYTMKFVSNAVEPISGYKAEEFIGNSVRSYFSIIHPEDRDRVKAAIEQGRLEGKPYDIQYRILHKDGSVRWVHGKGRSVDFIDGKAALQGVIIDITEQKENEFELEEYRNNLERIVEQKTMELENAQMNLLQTDKMASLGILTSGIAHEINNPLNYIMGGSNILEKYYQAPLESGINDSEIPLIIKNIRIGIERIVKIIEGLNQFSRENKDYDEECDLHAIIDNCLSMLYGRIKQKVNVKRFYTDNQTLVLGNTGKLHQAFLNVLNNAAEAIPEEGTISISTGVDNEFLIVTISDTGTGIKKKDLQLITDPFFTTKDPGRGTGLGLAITYSIIDAHKGTIEFISEPGAGTSVIIKLPRLQNE